MSRRPARASGKFVLRLDPGLHGALREAAREAGLSLNDWCGRKLALPVGSGMGIAGAAEVVALAARLFGAQLLGVIAHGSWARDELGAGSDVDVVVVVAPEIRLTRALYAAWDQHGAVWDGREVEPHFAHLPPGREVVAGLWAEIALDGVVLFERGIALSKRLVQVRRDIVAGRIARKMVHGQPYFGRSLPDENPRPRRHDVTRAEIRLRALDVLFDAESWADVVRESQEVVELALKGLLRARGVDPPRIHDVSDVLLAEQERLPTAIRRAVGELARISKELRRDRELAFYGAEDLTPSDFYRRDDAERAREGARTTVSLIKPHVVADER